MIDRLKAALYRAFPEFAAASEAYQATRRSGRPSRGLPLRLHVHGTRGHAGRNVRGGRDRAPSGDLQGADIFVDVGANIAFTHVAPGPWPAGDLRGTPVPGTCSFSMPISRPTAWNDVKSFPSAFKPSRPGRSSRLRDISVPGGELGGSSNKRRVIPLSTLDTLLGNDLPAGNWL